MSLLVLFEDNVYEGKEGRPVTGFMLRQCFLVITLSCVISLWCNASFSCSLILSAIPVRNYVDLPKNCCCMWTLQRRGLHSDMQE